MNERLRPSAQIRDLKVLDIEMRLAANGKKKGDQDFVATVINIILTCLAFAVPVKT